MKSALLSLLLGSVLCACVVRATPPSTTNGGNGTGGGNGSGGNNGGNGGGNNGIPLGTIAGPAGASLLLVDNEWISDGTQLTTPSYQTFSSLLTNAGLTYDTFVSNFAGPDGVPTAADLAPYATVVWFTGEAYGGSVGSSPMTSAQEAIVDNWLDQGSRTLLVFSENLVYNLSNPQCSWAGPETDPLLANYLGAGGDACDFTCDVCPGQTVYHSTYSVAGQPGTVLANEQYEVTGDSPIKSTANAINPAVGANVDVLANVYIDPNGQGDVAGPVVVGRKGVGAKATSQIVYVGVPVENFAELTGYGDATTLFNGLLSYAGL